MSSINEVHRAAQRLRDEILELRGRTYTTKPERDSLLLMESHMKCVEELAFRLGNSQDPQG